MRVVTGYTLRMLMSFVLLVVIACEGRGTQGATKMEVAELGLSMHVPPGWRVDEHNPRMCAMGDNTGLVIDEPLEGRVFEEYADQLCKAQGGRTRSKTPLTISGRDAIQAVIEYPDAGSTALKAYIHHGERLIEVSFVTPREHFAQHESSLRKSISGIQIK